MVLLESCVFFLRVLFRSLVVRLNFAFLMPSASFWELCLRGDCGWVGVCCMVLSCWDACDLLHAGGGLAPEMVLGDLVLI